MLEGLSRDGAGQGIENRAKPGKPRRLITLSSMCLKDLFTLPIYDVLATYNARTLLSALVHTIALSGVYK